MTRIAVGSRSQYKIDAVRDAAGLLWKKNVDVVGADVGSGVSAQPMSNEESIQGARNRARAALGTCDACYGLGIENGLVQVEGIWFATTWIVAVDSEGGEGIASTMLRPVPSLVMERVLAGLELSDAVHEVIPADVREEYSGLIGIITRGALNRHDVLRDGVVVAMSALPNSDSC